MDNFRPLHNKLLKTDYQRSAILVLVWYRVYGGLFEFRGSVASHLAGRYVLIEN
ncbi:DUF3265 domain-containing protein [Photobacterium sanctipauli]|uniref:DUF3265 domain-containing protein n=1 Tax=Photobacterium sanctipauli TaxID=1342794 RepID=A0A2T3N7Q1_9GAMM|nr:DUF3265 domain-containing protein [Photobacterium sanctipauli]